jgi:uncharacterized membrane protein YsdA (DUF1294 family)/cold shock CspA family protein
MRLKGTLTQWNEARGFGFIEPVEGGERVFCHARAFRDCEAAPANGIRVTYTLGRDDRGRARAEDVWLSLSTRTAPKAPGASSSHIRLALTVSGLFLLALVIATLLDKLTLLAVPWYLALSTVTFFAYGLDKTAARQDRRRTPERVLQFLALLGGWPGGWIAQRTIRHKSRKISFQIEFWICVIVNVIVLAALIWKGGELPPEWLPSSDDYS